MTRDKIMAVLTLRAVLNNNNKLQETTPVQAPGNKLSISFKDRIYGAIINT